MWWYNVNYKNKNYDVTLLCPGTNLMVSLDGGEIRGEKKKINIMNLDGGKKDSYTHFSTQKDIHCMDANPSIWNYIAIIHIYVEKHGYAHSRMHLWVNK